MKRLERRALLKGAGFVLLAAAVRESSAREGGLRDETFDVVVVGAGGAGLAAAVAAADEGARVVVLEKAPQVGGNTWLSGGYLNAEKDGDRAQAYVRDMLEAGGGVNDPGLVRTLARHSGEALAWLKSLGVEFFEAPGASFGGIGVRAYKPLMPDGKGYIHALSRAAARLGVIVRTKARVTDILREPPQGPVTGVRWRDASGRSRRTRAERGVVLAAGGFGANHSLIARWAPQYADLQAVSSPLATGEVMLAAERIGARLRDLSHVECLPGPRRESRFRPRLHGDPERFIFVDARGRRFVREDGFRNGIRDAVLSLRERMCFLVMDNEGFGAYDELIRRDSIRGVETGDIFCAESLSALGGMMGLPEGALEATVSRFNESVRLGDDPVGRTRESLLFPIAVPPFWGAPVFMAVHSTLGGAAISPGAEVLDNTGRAIPGLFAAGEITGGVHGAGRLGGDALIDAFVFGRIAGRACAGRN